MYMAPANAKCERQTYQETADRQSDPYVVLCWRQKNVIGTNENAKKKLICSILFNENN